MKNKILAILTSAFAFFGCISPVPIYAEEKPYKDFPHKNEFSNYAIFKFSGWPTSNNSPGGTICAVTYEGQLILNPGTYEGWTADYGISRNNNFTISKRPVNGNLKWYEYLNGEWVYKYDFTGSSDRSINETSCYVPTNDNRYNYSIYEFVNPMYECSENILISGNNPGFKNGEIFFQAPVPGIQEALNRVVTQGAQVLASQTGGNLKILVLCGVGCLALLMALATLLRVLRRFLGK